MDRPRPEKGDAALAGGLPPFTMAAGEFPAGVALPIAKARLTVADFDASRTVATEGRVVTFAVDLKAGPTKLQTWFYDADGKEPCGAFYVYVQRT